MICLCKHFTKSAVVAAHYYLNIVIVIGIVVVCVLFLWYSVDFLQCLMIFKSSSEMPIHYSARTSRLFSYCQLDEWVEAFYIHLQKGAFFVIVMLLNQVITSFVLFPCFIFTLLLSFKHISSTICSFFLMLVFVGFIDLHDDLFKKLFLWSFQSSTFGSCFIMLYICWLYFCFLVHILYLHNHSQQYGKQHKCRNVVSIISYLVINYAQHF